MPLASLKVLGGWQRRNWFQGLVDWQGGYTAERQIRFRCLGRRRGQEPKSLPQAPARPRGDGAVLMDWWRVGLQPRQA